MADITESTIAQQAFIFLELSPLSSFGDDTPQVTQAAAFYARALRSVLAHADWSDARKLVSLPQADLPDTEVADPDLPYLYVLPADCVRLRKVLDDCRWRTDGRYLRADKATSLLIRYTQAIENESRLSDVLQTAVALQLAILLAPKWLVTRTKIETLKADLAEALTEAARIDRENGSVDSWHADDSPDIVAEALR